MRVLLIRPYTPIYPRDVADLGLGYLASCLKKEGHSVELCLRAKDVCTPSAFAKFIQHKEYDIFGFKVMSSTVRSARELSRTIRERYPDAKILMGGPHPAADPHSTFALMPEANYAFVGEAELGISQLVNKLAKGNISESKLAQIPSLVWKKGSQTVVNERKFIENLDEIPFPLWDLMHPASFDAIFNGYSRRMPIAPIILTRGCPSKCTFCASEKMNGYAVRTRSVENIMKEIYLLTEKFGVRELHFYDNNCSHPKSPLREVLRRIIREKIDISWSAPPGIRIDSIEDSLPALMKESGCFQVNVGIESGSPRVLKMIKKGLTLDMARDRIKKLRDAGIEVMANFIIGFPGETKKEIEQTINFSLELPLTQTSYFIFIPLPGTEMYNKAFKHKKDDIEFLSSLDFWNYKNNLSEVSHEELKKIIRSAYLRFHLRPGLLKYQIRNINTIPKFLHITKRIFTILHGRAA